MNLTEKPCKTCGENKPLSAFVSSGRGDGLKKATCKVCEYAVGKKYLLENKEKRAETVRKYREANAEKLAATLREYKKKNAEAIKEKAAEYRRLNAEKIRARINRHYQNNREKILASKKEYYQKHPERLYEKGAKYFQANAETFSKKEKEYRALFPEKGRERLMRRRSRKLNATPIWFSDFDELVVKEAAKLAVDRERLTGVRWHVDHVIPLQGKTVCGLHIGLNLSVIPATQNQRKGNRLWTTNH